MKRSSTSWVVGRWIAAASLLVIGVARLQAADKPTLGEGMAFYASFEQSAEADYARGVATARGQYRAAEGMAGKGIQIGADPPRYLQPGNLDRTAGTLAFWVKTPIDLMNDSGRSTYYRDLFSAAIFNLRAFVDPARQPRLMLCFMTGETLPGRDFEWDYGTAASLKELPANRWTHVALTWNQPAGRKAIYIDGRRIAAGNTRLLAPGDNGDDLTLGGGIPGAYDELAIWRRELTPQEIVFLVKKPAEAAKELQAAAKAQARQSIQWTIYPNLVFQNYADSLVEPNEALALKLPLENRTNQEQAGKITIQVQDVWDKPVGEAQNFEVKLAAGEKQELPFKVSVAKFGAYRVAVTVEAGGARQSRDVTTFGCLPKDPPPSHPFFGGHINQAGTMPQMGRRLGFAHNRVHNMTQFTWWCRMEPRPNDWAMEGSGAYQSYMDLGYTHYGQWMYAPYWAVTLPDGKHPPAPRGTEAGNWVPTDLEALRAYVRESLKRFPAIKEWEIWNEPYVSIFWQGTPRQYVDLCKVVYTEAKKARPDITIYSQLYFEGPWTRDAMKLGVLNYCDAVAYHFYHHPNNDPQSATDPIRKLKALLAQNGRPDMPILASEGGMDSTTFLRGLDFDDLRNLSPGPHKWLGVPFVIAGKDGFKDKCTLTMKGRTFPNGPQTAGPIPVNLGLRGLFFVAAANWTNEGQTIGEYIVHYVDGQEVKLPIMVGQNIDNWWYDHQESEDSRTVAFRAVDPVDSNYPYRFLRIWYWENTRPTSEIQSVSIRSLSNNSTFTVVAITAAVQ